MKNLKCTSKLDKMEQLKRAMKLIALVAVGLNLVVECQAKEIDWTDLGVALSGSKAGPIGASAASNLRILVSPQRRMTKG